MKELNYRTVQYKTVPQILPNAETDLLFDATQPWRMSTVFRVESPPHNSNLIVPNNSTFSADLYRRHLLYQSLYDDSSTAFEDFLVQGVPLQEIFFLIAEY